MPPGCTALIDVSFDTVFTESDRSHGLILSYSERMQGSSWPGQEVWPAEADPGASLPRPAGERAGGGESAALVPDKALKPAGR